MPKLIPYCLFSCTLAILAFIKIYYFLSTLRLFLLQGFYILFCLLEVLYLWVCTADIKSVVICHHPLWGPFEHPT